MRISLGSTKDFIHLLKDFIELLVWLGQACPALYTEKIIQASLKDSYIFIGISWGPLRDFVVFPKDVMGNP